MDTWGADNLVLNLTSNIEYKSRKSQSEPYPIIFDPVNLQGKNYVWMGGGFTLEEVTAEGIGSFVEYDRLKSDCELGVVSTLIIPDYGINKNFRITDLKLSQVVKSKYFYTISFTEVES